MDTKHIIENQMYDEERALYAIQDTKVTGCTFAGPADGESVLKEVRNVQVEDCIFSLRYPLWHAKNFELTGAKMDEKTRAALWYTEDGVISDCDITSIKAVRECDRTKVKNSRIVSQEFGWKCRGLEIVDSEIESEYFLLDSSDITIENLKMKGKYSFQYNKNVHIKNSVLDTKDAFWHGENILVENSIVKGEYLAWFSDGLTLINCHIIGTQPLCYCKNLKLINCTMEGCDLSFEYSDVEADVKGHILSVKNPKSGHIVADSVGEIVTEDSIMEVGGEVIIRTAE